jgi:hypothetical protein
MTEPSEGQEPSEQVEIDVDEQKLAAWDAIKSDYEVEPDGQPVPNAMDEAGFIADNANPDADADTQSDSDSDARA